MQALVLLACAVLLAYAMRRALGAKKTPLVRPGGTERHPFHCVEVQSDDAACTAVRQLAGLRFLSAQAPLLPVVGCNAAVCSCRYVHRDDRRQEDRRNPYGQHGGVPPGITGERRSRAERRKAMGGPFRPVITS